MVCKSIFHEMLPKTPPVEDIARPDDDPLKGLIPLVISSSGASLRILKDCPEWIAHVEKMYAAKNRSRISKKKAATSHDNLASKNTAERVRQPAVRPHDVRPTLRDRDVDSINNESMQLGDVDSDVGVGWESDEGPPHNLHKNKAARHLPVLQRQPKFRPYPEDDGPIGKDARRDKRRFMDDEAIMPREKQHYAASYGAAPTVSRSTMPRPMGRPSDADEYRRYHPDEYVYQQVDHEAASPPLHVRKRARYEDDYSQYQYSDGAHMMRIPKLAVHKKSKAYQNHTHAHDYNRMPKTPEAGPSRHQREYDVDFVDQSPDDLVDETLDGSEDE
jgi:hypothetical protein